jgi:hypothetical protein
MAPRSGVGGRRWWGYRPTLVPVRARAGQVPTGVGNSVIGDEGVARALWDGDNDGAAPAVTTVLRSWAMDKPDSCAVNARGP